jgi:predicted DNA-binding WGR domain protein
MRRFEFVEGTSAKFWMADVEGTSFVVIYGRLGTSGQRKDKAFPDEKAARRELDKKIAEKLREGYHEVAADAAAAAPAGAKGAAAAAPRLALPSRVPANAAPSPAQLAAATGALGALRAVLGKRSWRVSARARAAVNALQALGGIDPTTHAALQQALEPLLASVAAPRKQPRLPLRLAMALLMALDVAAFERALAAWREVKPDAPAAVALAELARQRDALESPELALRLGALLSDRPDFGGSPEASWQRRWRTLAPHLEGYLVARGTTLRNHVRAIAPGRDPHIARRVERLGAA